jgi:hypothetical protein
MDLPEDDNSITSELADFSPRGSGDVTWITGTFHLPAALPESPCLTLTLFYFQ